jgi:hypothetical protein
VRAWNPLFFPDRLPSVGQSLMVTNNNAHRLMVSFLSSSHTCTHFSSHNVLRSSTTVSNIHRCHCLASGCFEPSMIIGTIMNFHFMHIHGGRLNIHKATGQVIWPLLNSPNGLNPSVFKPNRMFLRIFQTQGILYQLISTTTLQRGTWSCHLVHVLLCANATVCVLSRQAYQGGTRSSRLCGGGSPNLNSKVKVRTWDTDLYRSRPPR